jgi:hypothetical protein
MRGKLFTREILLFILLLRGRFGFDCGGWSLNCVSRSSGLVKKSTIIFAENEALPVAA